MVHHAVLHVVNRLLMAQSASLLGDAQVGGVDELDELLRLMIEQYVGHNGFCRRLPEDRIAGGDVGFAHRQARGGIASVTIGAPEDHIGRGVHLLDALVAFEATAALGHCLLGSLVDPIMRFGHGRGLIPRYRDGRSESIILSIDGVRGGNHEGRPTQNRAYTFVHGLIGEREFHQTAV